MTRGVSRNSPARRRCQCNRFIPRDQFACAACQERHSHPGEKRCYACETWKSRTEFHRCQRSSDGLNNKCKACNYQQAKTWKSHHPEKLRARYHANPSAYINRNLKRLYGLSWDVYESILAKQGGVCAVCGASPSDKRRLAVDHDHATGQVRGLLCHACNLAIGQLGDDIQRIVALALYLTRHSLKEMNSYDDYDAAVS